MGKKYQCRVALDYDFGEAAKDKDDDAKMRSLKNLKSFAKSLIVMSFIHE